MTHTLQLAREREWPWMFVIVCADGTPILYANPLRCHISDTSVADQERKFPEVAIQRARLQEIVDVYNTHQ